MLSADTSSDPAYATDTLVFRDLLPAGLDVDTNTVIVDDLAGSVRLQDGEYSAAIDTDGQGRATLTVDTGTADSYPFVYFEATISELPTDTDAFANEARLDTGDVLPEIRTSTVRVPLLPPKLVATLTDIQRRGIRCISAGVFRFPP